MAPAHGALSAPKHTGPAYDHRKKHVLAAGAGAIINARLDRMLGMDNVIGFLGDVESGRIEQLRQRCLYVENTGGSIHIPERAISRQQAQFYAVLSGELLAEILGFEPNEFERLLERVEQFEAKLGFDVE